MNNTTNSWEEKDPEPISAQIEGLDDIYREYIDEKLSPAKKYEKVKEILSTAHRNGVIEGKRENAINVDEFFADGILHGTDVASKMIREALIKQGAESMKAKAIEIVEKIDASGGGSGRRIKIQLLDALNKLTP